MNNFEREKSNFRYNLGLQN